MEKVHISDINYLENKLKIFTKDGKNKLHILADFDKTLTTYKLPNGEYMPSLISRIRNGNYLSYDYSIKANELYDFYHKIEIDSSIGIEIKKKEMYNWWKKHFELLGKSGLTRQVIEKVADDLIESKKIQLRKGVREFFGLMNKNKVPIIIISSSIGDLINSYLRKEELLFDNVHVISNKLKYDLKGNFTGVEKIVHVFNKDETVLSDYKVIYNQVKERKNVILLGDSLGDLGMVSGFEYDEIIKVGFLNENIQENLQEYKNNFDIVVEDDGDFSKVNKIIKKMID